ncbi:hypothetical protein PoB_003773600 [Plakobranchus ocellatus]|uniref:ShKT domain-containing protein n=1 Tax=Plakobranchus ocellatus TaxID=259542 RepID=A0AAV4AJ78_9GAST|nr:hypothetical protein PoB_003773600 [Plakobranchus ocellatus]
MATYLRMPYAKNKQHSTPGSAGDGTSVSRNVRQLGVTCDVLVLTLTCFDEARWIVCPWTCRHRGRNTQAPSGSITQAAPPTQPHFPGHHNHHHQGMQTTKPVPVGTATQSTTIPVTSLPGLPAGVQTTQQVSTSGGRQVSTGHPVVSSLATTAASIAIVASPTCRDQYPGTCLSLAPACPMDALARKICPLTCGICKPPVATTSSAKATTATTPPATKAQTTSTPLPLATTITMTRSPGNRITTTSTLTGNTASAKSTSAGRTTTTSSASAKAATTATAQPRTAASSSAHQPTTVGGSANPTTTASIFKTSTTAAPSPSMTTANASSTRSCYQCGQGSNPCTVTELLTGSPMPCPAGQEFCATTVAQTRGQRTVFKTCVDKPTCIKDWYQVSSDRNKCVNFNPRDLSVTMHCNYCCDKDACNTGVKPAVRDLYTPHGAHP